MSDDLDELFEDEEIEAYCMTCRQKVPIDNPQAIWTRRGAPGTRGTCQVCGTTVFRMGKTAAYATLRYILDNDIPGKVNRVGNYFMTRLENLKQKFDSIAEVRGRGLLIALEFNQEIAERLVLFCLGRGLLVNKVKPNALRFMPPLITTEEEMDKAIGILGGALGEIRDAK